MWRSSLGVGFIATGALLSVACALSLDVDVERSDTDEPAPAPVAPGCVAMGEHTEVRALGGGVRSHGLPDGSVLWVVENLELEDGSSVPNGVLTTPPGASGRDCMNDAAILGDGLLPQSPRGPDHLVSARGAVFAESLAWAYYALYESDAEASFGVELVGYGVSRGDTDLEFGSEETLLWTADRPSFGAAALLWEGHAYVYGCLPARFLSADCYVARAPVADADRVAAYEYWTGGDHWSSNVDAAWPMVEAGQDVSVVYLPERDRFVMGYATPLGTEILLRSGLGPSGPWSAPVGVATCQKPAEDPDAVCVNVQLHPGLDAGADELVATYATASSGPGQGEHPDRYTTRLIELGSDVVHD